MPERPWILFDIGGVLELVDDDTWPQQWWDRWRRHAGLSAEEFEARLAVADLPPIDIETGTGERFWGAVGRMLGIDTDDVAVMRADFWDAYCGTGNAELFAYIETLPARANLAILSNSVDGAREEEERRFGLSRLFDPICYSHEQGVNKPDPQAYLRALERLNARPDQVFFVDDHSEAIDGAAAVGIRGVLQRDNAVTIAAIEDFLVSR